MRQDAFGSFIECKRNERTLLALEVDSACVSDFNSVVNDVSLVYMYFISLGGDATFGSDVLF